MMSAVATTNATALMIAIVHAVSAFSTPARLPVAHRTMSANNGRNRRLNWDTTP